MSKYIDSEKLKEKIYAEDTVSLAHGSLPEFDQGCHYAFLIVLSFIASLQQEMPDKETILRICKLHKAWSIMAPWENVEDFVMTNWNSENIV